MTRAAKVLAELGRIPVLLDQVRAVRDEFEKKRESINQFDGYTPEYREKTLAGARKVADSKIQGLTEQIEATRALAASQLETMRTELAPSGAEGIAARMESADARSRVRSMVTNGQDIRAVLGLAIQRGDRLMIEAAKEEARWTSDGNHDGFDIVADRALVDLVDPESADVMRAEYMLKHQGATLEHEIQAAGLDGLTLQSAVAAHYGKEAAKAFDLDSGDDIAIGASTLHEAVADHYATNGTGTA